MRRAVAAPLVASVVAVLLFDAFRRDVTTGHDLAAPAQPPLGRPATSAGDARSAVPRAASIPPEPVACADATDALCFIEVRGRRFVAGAQSTSPGLPSFDLAANDDDGPVHEVAVETFWLQQLEVPAFALRACLDARACRASEVSSVGAYVSIGHTDRSNLPANAMTALGAAQLCAFLGGRLPTPDEWELAARDGPASGGYATPLPTSCENTWFLGACHEPGPRRVVPRRGWRAFAGMEGNVAEWTSGVAPDGRGELRGGGWGVNRVRESLLAGRRRSPGTDRRVAVGSSRSAFHVPVVRAPIARAASEGCARSSQPRVVNCSPRGDDRPRAMT